MDEGGLELAIGMGYTLECKEKAQAIKESTHIRSGTQSPGTARAASGKHEEPERRARWVENVKGRQTLKTPLPHCESPAYNNLHSGKLAFPSLRRSA